MALVAADGLRSRFSESLDDLGFVWDASKG
jgi:hypothetical protein